VLKTVFACVTGLSCSGRAPEAFRYADKHRLHQEKAPDAENRANARKHIDLQRENMATRHLQ
jgi:hypothetical protein